MRQTLLAIALVLVVGCSKKPSVAELKKLKEEACACKDKACAERVNKKLEDTVGDASEDDVGKEGMDATLDAVICIEKAKSGFNDLGK